MLERNAKRTEAAIKIQNAWRKHETYKIKKLNLQMATAYAHSFGKIEVVQIEGLKTCCLCQKETAMRQCKSEVNL